MTPPPPRPSRAQALADGKLLYRDPGLNDRLADDPVDTVALIDELVVEHVLPHLTDELPRPGGYGVLDLGCGTGALAGGMGPRRRYLGVDVQPWLTDHARRTWSAASHAPARFETGDLTTFRADERFEVVVCLGNTLAYLHTGVELAAACRTFAAHLTEGGDLLLQTLVAAPTPGRSIQTLDLHDARVEVVVQTEWDPSTETTTTTRT